MAEAKDKTKKTKTKKPDNLEEPVAEETDITKAAVDAAEQENVVIAEKRSTEPVMVAEDRQTLTETEGPSDSETGNDIRDGAVGKPTAKAGRRSAKALKEEEEKRAKEQRKAAAETPGDGSPETRAAHKPTHRTAEDRLKARGKGYRKMHELIDKSKDYSLKESIDLAVKTSPTKFDATVEMHVNLAVDPRHADQNVRANLVLPAGTGKTVRVAVFADVDDAAKAKKAGADIAGADELAAALEKGTIEFDTLIATPAMMGKLGKYARMLGPKGLMPNPKSGTVTADVSKAVQEAKAGRVDYRVDSTGIVHVGFGKVSFGNDKLMQNATAVLTSIKAAKPATIKGSYVKAVHITTSMGPSIKVATSEVNQV